MARFRAVLESGGARRCSPGLWRRYVFTARGPAGGTSSGSHQPGDESHLSHARSSRHGRTTGNGRHARRRDYPRDGNDHTHDARRRAWRGQHPYAVRSHGRPRRQHPHAECELCSARRDILGGSHGSSRRTHAHITGRRSARGGSNPHASGWCAWRRFDTDASRCRWCSWWGSDPDATGGLGRCAWRWCDPHAADRRIRWSSRGWCHAHAARCSSRWSRGGGPRGHSVGRRGRFG